MVSAVTPNHRHLCDDHMLRQEPDCASVMASHILAVDPTVHLSKRPTGSDIKPGSSSPLFLVAGERIDRNSALSNSKGKHLDQFLKFPIKGSTIARSLSVRGRKFAQITSQFYTSRRSRDVVTPTLHTQISDRSRVFDRTPNPRLRAFDAAVNVAPVVRTSSISTHTRTERLS
jgi:hypothetical protein